MGVEITVEGLTKSFGSQVIWQDVSLTLPAGEISVLLGPSGTGKSVFLKTLVGLLRPDAGAAFERLANLATKAGVEGRTKVRIHTPLLRLTKAEIVKLGRELELDFGLTYSCYDPLTDGLPCGQCDACLLRRKGFEEAGIEDR